MKRRFLLPPIQARAQRGIALIECLMALLIVSFGVLGLMGLEARVISFSTDSEDRSRASMFAGEVASQMWLNSTVSLPAATVTALQASASNIAQGGLPNGQLAITAVAPNAADITVTWTPPKDQTLGTLSTLTTRVILP